jgi:hypothetical protein
MTSTTTSSTPATDASLEVLTRTQPLINAFVDERTAHYNAMTKDEVLALAREQFDGVKASDSKKAMIEDLVYVDCTKFEPYQEREKAQARASQEQDILRQIAQYGTYADACAARNEGLAKYFAERPTADTEDTIDLVLSYEKRITFAGLFQEVAYAVEGHGMSPVDALRAVRKQTQQQVNSQAYWGENSSSNTANVAKRTRLKFQAKFLEDTARLAREI